MPLIWSGLPYIRQRKLYSLEMPNSVNFAFSYHIFAQVDLTAHALVRACIHACCHGFLLVSMDAGLLPGFHMCGKHAQQGLPRCTVCVYMREGRCKSMRSALKWLTECRSASSSCSPWPSFSFTLTCSSSAQNDWQMLA